MGVTHISVAQAKAEFAAMVAKAEQGEDVIVTRNGRPVARLTRLEQTPVVYGDLVGLYVPDDLMALSIPSEITDAFDAK
jgi:prevent-host-death family protein